MSGQLGFWRSCRLLAGAALRRRLNRLSSGRPAKNLGHAGGPPPGARPPTARRRAGTFVLLLLLFPIFSFQLGVGAWRHLVEVSGYASGWLEPSEETVTAIRAWVSDNPVRSLALVPESGSAADQAVRERWWNDVDRILTRDPEVQVMTKVARERTIELWHAAIAKNPHSWSLRSHFEQPLAAEDDAVRRLALARAASFALLVICAFLLTTGLGMGNQDLGQVEWSLLWYATQPVTNRVLVAVQWLQAALFTVVNWIILPPFFVVCGIIAGLGWWSAPFAVGATLAIVAMVAAIRITIETWLRLRFAPSRLKNIQALATIVSLMLMVGLYAAAFASMPRWYLAMATQLPWDLQPFGWFTRAAFAPSAAGNSFTAGLALAGAMTWAALRLCERWLAPGLVDGGGALVGSRAISRKVRDWSPLSLLNKDLLLLRRDRAVLVQILVVPCFMIALQLVINPGMVHGITHEFRHAAALAFVLGSYVLLHSATTVLTVEGAALWLLCGAPHPLERLLLQKVALWAGLALAYACIAMGAAFALVPAGSSAPADALMVLIGLPIYAVIAAGLGAAATDPLETTPQRRLRPETLWLFLVLMGMYTQTLYVADAHGRIAYILLSGVLAYALWQRLADRLPYLLDPADRPPRELALSDGALAAMTFLVSQGVIMLILSQMKVGFAVALPWAFAGAGVLAAGMAMLLLARERVHNLWRVTGLMPRAGALGPMRSALLGAGAGTAAAGVAALWLYALRHIEGLGWMLPDESASFTLPFSIMVLLTVVLAPLCEEFIFRGLVYGGLRRSLPIRWAIPAAAAIFAIVHPSVSVIPVFTLGLAAALVYEASGWLLAPLIAHAVYNGIVLFLQA